MASTCAACQQPLVLSIEISEDEEDVQMSGSGTAAAAAAPTSSEVPDDIGLSCGCHFHWQCLLDAYTVTECPSCSKNILTIAPDGTQQVLCSVNNEGGFEQDEDLLPLLSEESYLKAYPEERKARAFLEFCRQGAVQEIVTMLQDDDDDDDEDEDEDTMQEGKQIDLLRYQDPLGDMQSGLHAAVAGGSREVAWLLLLLASTLDLQAFPPQVLHEAEAAGIARDDQQGKVDIRSLHDANGKSAEQLASEQGGVWLEWCGNQRLAV